ncbi:CLUMA_CG018766, isoform A [Clunio marinus]|uniref:Gustatory receptor n=1 Tax=Clunio marinus TaxID=568069 RepID=A0A1J1J4E1_9DIPT|nr:CLUMA_CG018766, isoform A [Clunio marinus]
MVYQLLKRHEIIKLLHILNDFDAKAKALEVKLNLKASRKFILKTVMFILCGVLVVSIGTAFIFEMKIHYGAGCLMPLSYGYLLLYLSMLILQFSFSTLAIKNRFCLLNDNLRFTFQNSLAKGNSTLANGNANRLHEQLSNTIRDLYSNLCDGIDLVNESLTFQLIPFLVYYLTANLFAIYSTIREVFYQTPLMYIAIGTNICWMILHSVIASIALYSGHITTKCALRTPIIVSSILRNCKDKESPFTKDAFKTFLLEVQHRNMFIENEFFRIDWKLLFSMISTITTFLVITCQFDASLSNDSVIKNSTLG